MKLESAPPTTSRQRLLDALEGRRPDRLPATTHSLMPYFLNRSLGGVSEAEFYATFGLDPSHWIARHKPGRPEREYFDPSQEASGLLDDRRIVSADWRIVPTTIGNPADRTCRYDLVTPKGTLSLVLQSNDQTSWLLEHPVKKKSDIDLLAEFMTVPHCDIETVNRAATAFGGSGLVRGHVCGFDLFGQPGCWQDACCLVGTQEMILAAYDDPSWVRELLGILQRRKLAYVASLAGAEYDLIGLGGGDASTTVISPKLFREFVAPYDAPIIEAAHQAGQRIVYHTCGGMMPILEDIVAMGPDAVETLTPPAMGGDVDLAEVKRRIGGEVCLIGGFDQFHYFVGCEPGETRVAVRRCFEEAGEGGGYILSPSDHFFEAEVELLHAYADEARRCEYN